MGWWFSCSGLVKVNVTGDEKFLFICFFDNKDHIFILFFPPAKAILLCEGTLTCILVCDETASDQSIKPVLF